MFSIVATSVFICISIKYPISCIQAALWLALWLHLIKCSDSDIVWPLPLAWWSVSWTHWGVPARLYSSNMLCLGWGLEYWVILCRRGWFLSVLFLLPHFCCPAPHTVSARLLLWFDVLGFWFLCCFGPDSWGGFCIPGPQGFTILLPPPFGWLCFTSLEGLVREKLPASPKMREDQQSLGSGIFLVPCSGVIFLLCLPNHHECTHALGVTGFAASPPDVQGFWKKCLVKRWDFMSFPQWHLILSFMPAKPREILSGCFASLLPVFPKSFLWVFME